MRWVQLTLVENDPGRFDPAFWLDYFKRLHADAATLSAGGIVAYYPTDVPLHHRSAWLGSSDPFGTLVAGCRALGMNVVARTDPHAARDEVRAAHPDWISVTSDGEPRRHWANPELWVTCALGPYNFDFMDQVHRGDRHAGTRSTASSRTGGLRRAATATAVIVRRTSGTRPATICRAPPIATIPLRRAYLEWRKDRLTELWKHWDATVRAANPDARFIPNGPPDLKTAGELAEIQFTDNQARRGVMPPWANGRRAKEYRSVMGRRPIGGIFSVGLEEPYRWKDSVQSDPEVRLWVAEGTANGMRPWVTKFSGRAVRPALAAGGGAHLRLALPARALPAQRSAARARRAAALGADRAPITQALRRATATRITCSGCITRSSRAACRSSSCTKPS